MEAEDILIELKELSHNKEITKDEIMEILKKYARIISVQDLMLATARMRKDGEFVQKNYREKYLSVYIKYFIMRMKEVKEFEDYDNVAIDKESFDTSFPMLERTFEKERLGNSGEQIS